MATHSSILAWRIPGTGEPDGLPSLGSHRVGHDWSDLAAAAAAPAAACEMSAIVQKFEHSLALPLYGIKMKTDSFQSCGHCCIFQICWHIKCSTVTASSFRIWNVSSWIPSPLLALLRVMIPKAHLTSHSKISGSRWGTTTSWLSRSLRSFLYSTSLYYCHLFLVSSASGRSTLLLSFIELIFAWNVPLVISNFL